jgi:hypothetical protein
MLDAIKTRLISWLLSNTVARWVAVDEKNVKVAGKGLQAEQLQVCTDCLDGLGLPITVAAGHVGKVSVEWVSKTVFRIIVEEADVHVRPRINDDDWANNWCVGVLRYPLPVHTALAGQSTRPSWHLNLRGPHVHPLRASSTP